MDGSPTKTTAAALRAMEVAEQVKSTGFGGLSDQELRERLHTCALDVSYQNEPGQTARAIGLVDLAVRRRIGLWRAVLSDPRHLTGAIKAIREAAGDIIGRARSASTGTQGVSLEDWARTQAAGSGVGDGLKPALHWLLISLARTLAEHPSDMLLPAEFYGSLIAADDTGCLAFSPTVQQLAAASLLLRGTVVEMDSGDGKTLASMVAAAVFAAAGRSVHVLTANDYLASRDCDELAPVLEPLGLSVGLVIENMDRDERRHQYVRQIVFTTARESGFDYLRDSVAPSLDWRVRPVFDVAIVDEVDHQLVDQARTPLIISDGPTHEAEAEVGDRCEDLADEVIERQAHYVDDLYARIDEESRPDRLLAEIMLAGGLTPRLISTLERLNVSARMVRLDMIRMNDDADGSLLESELLFAIDVGGPALRLTEGGWRFIWERADVPTTAFEVVQMLRARVVHDADEDYVIGEDRVTLVDPLDGRPMHSHRYMDGLHEALEAKEGIEGRGRNARQSSHHDPRPAVQLRNGRGPHRDGDGGQRGLRQCLRRGDRKSSVQRPISAKRPGSDSLFRPRRAPRGRVERGRSLASTEAARTPDGGNCQTVRGDQRRVATSRRRASCTERGQPDTGGRDCGGGRRAKRRYRIHRDGWTRH